MSESVVRARIKTIMESASGVYNVYDTERYFNTEADRLSVMKATVNDVDQIRAWMISQGSGEEKQDIIGVGTSSGGVLIRRHYIIKGWLGLKDSETTEKTLNTIISNIQKKFRDNRNLSGDCWMHEGLQVDKISHIDMTGILCNYCELSLVVLERV